MSLKFAYDMNENETESCYYITTLMYDLEVPDLWWSVDGSSNDVTPVGRQLNTFDANLLGGHQVGRRRADRL